MGEVIASLRVMPDDVNVNIEQLASEVKKTAEKESKYLQHEIQPVAFGLKAIIIYISVPDAEGGTEKVENAIAKIPHVQSVEVTEVTRV